MMFLWWLFAIGKPVEGLQRTVYDVQIIEGRQIVNAKLALNFLNENHFSLHLVKSPAGTLFTYWATPEKNVLSFPKQKAAFIGGADESFSLFVEGPRMSRKGWLELLQTGKYESLGPWRLHLVDGWFSLHDEPITFRIRWQERQSSWKSKVSDRVLYPQISDRLEVQPLNALLGFKWSLED